MDLKSYIDPFMKAYLTQVVGIPWDESPYEVLGLPMWAPEEHVKAKFRELAMEHHPDHGGDPEQFRRIVAAYEKLVGKA